jgi:hypothetical protein
MDEIEKLRDENAQLREALTDTIGTSCSLLDFLYCNKQGDSMELVSCRRGFCKSHAERLLAIFPRCSGPGCDRAGVINGRCYVCAALNGEAEPYQNPFID